MTQWSGDWHQSINYSGNYVTGHRSYLRIEREEGVEGSIDLFLIGKIELIFRREYRVLRRKVKPILRQRRC